MGFHLNEVERILEVAWADGHTSRYGLPALRSECPCAVCRQGREDARSNPFRVLAAGEGTPEAAELRDAEPIGRYAVRLVWGDGHQTGIYAFDYLRSICPCDECRALRTPDATPYVHGIYIPGSG